MASKALALGAATVGGVMIYSGLAGVSVMDVLAGRASLKGADPKGGKGISPEDLQGLQGIAGISGDGGTTGEGLSGTPKEVIDTIVLPLARKHRMVTGRNAAMVTAANAAHSTNTTSGNVSDHKGPPEHAWAADMSNGTSPTAQMDALAQEIADTFHIPWDGAGVAEATWGGFRYQLLYRTTVGGNHFNHVHFGVKCVRQGGCHKLPKVRRSRRNGATPFGGMRTK